MSRQVDGSNAYRALPFSRPRVLLVKGYTHPRSSDFFEGRLALPSSSSPSSPSPLSSSSSISSTMLSQSSPASSPSSLPSFLAQRAIERGSVSSRPANIDGSASASARDSSDFSTDTRDTARCTAVLAQRGQAKSAGSLKPRTSFWKRPLQSGQRYS